MAEELKLVQKSYDLCQWMFNHTEKFPKSRRFSIAVRIENQLARPQPRMNANSRE